MPTPSVSEPEEQSTKSADPQVQFLLKLERAADQLLSLTPGTCSARPERVMHLTFEQLHLPSFCKFVSNTVVDYSIHSFITLASNLCGLPVERGRVLLSKLQTIRDVHIPAAKYLGRLELIYELSCVLEDWIESPTVKDAGIR